MRVKYLSGTRATQKAESVQVNKELMDTVERRVDKEEKRSRTLLSACL